MEGVSRLFDDDARLFDDDARLFDEDEGFLEWRDHAGGVPVFEKSELIVS